ncbi:hypothetical protein [Streptomyces sp. NPDC057002]|uniref:hypothetical protein n=1 Tax=Streptomyces sp. NPDC057002 TaxID=3345992 RepID=UPI00363D2FFF
MARQLVQTAAVLCDWHAALPNADQVMADAQRMVSSGKEIDLCGFCALVWDLAFPRLEELIQMIQPDVIEVLMRSAHPLKDDAADKAPVQLAIKETAALEPPGPAKNKAKPASKQKTGGRRNGEWQPDVEQVRCPLPHRAGSPDPYWVKLRDRGSHARSSHNLLGPQVAYELPDTGQLGGETIVFAARCFEHKVCAETGGFPFLDEAGLNCHIIKCRNWEKASEAKDAAETSAALTQAPAA